MSLHQPNTDTTTMVHSSYYCDHLMKSWRERVGDLGESLNVNFKYGWQRPEENKNVLNVYFIKGIFKCKTVTNNGYYLMNDKL